MLPPRTLRAPPKPAQVPFPPCAVLTRPAARVLMCECNAACRKFLVRF
jgi:hypothetical protein